MKRLFFLATLSFVFVLVNAQTTVLQLVSTTGETYKNTIYQLDWSIGELQTETYTTTGQILTQGFQQGEYSIVTLAQSLQFQVEIKLYPNPTKGFVNLKIENTDFGMLQYILTDLSGKILLNGKFKGQIQQINFSDLSVGAYFITIQLNNQFVKSFKIIKN